MQYCYDDNTKLRIVLILDEATNNKVLEFNEKINDGISHDIKFSESCIPHITLISGNLIKKSNFKKVSKIIKENVNMYFSDNRSFGFDDLYYADNGEWLFLGIKDDERLFKFVETLRGELKQYMKISDARHLHITIAKSRDLQMKAVMINNLNLPKNFIVQNVAIGLSGKDGVLLNIIEEYV